MVWRGVVLMAVLAVPVLAAEPTRQERCDVAIAACKKVGETRDDLRAVQKRQDATHRDDTDGNLRVQSQIAAVEHELGTRRRMALRLVVALEHADDEGLIYCANLCLGMMR